MSAIKKPIQDAILEAARAEAKLPTRLRFSLRSMMLLTVVAAVVCALLFSFPPGVAAIVCMFLQPCLIAALFSGALFAKGEPRFFCLGAILPTVLNLTSNFFGGGGLGGYWSLMMIGQQFGRGTPGKQTFGHHIEQLWELWQKMGYPMALQLATFLLTALLCGLTAVLTRRYLLKQTVVPAMLAEGESDLSNQESSPLDE